MIKENKYRLLISGSGQIDIALIHSSLPLVCKLLSFHMLLGPKGIRMKLFLYTRKVSFYTGCHVQAFLAREWMYDVKRRHFLCVGYNYHLTWIRLQFDIEDRRSRTEVKL